MVLVTLHIHGPYRQLFVTRVLKLKLARGDVVGALGAAGGGLGLSHTAEVAARRLDGGARQPQSDAVASKAKQIGGSKVVTDRLASTAVQLVISVGVGVGRREFGRP